MRSESLCFVWEPENLSLQAWPRISAFLFSYFWFCPLISVLFLSDHFSVTGSLRMNSLSNACFSVVHSLRVFQPSSNLAWRKNSELNIKWKRWPTCSCAAPRPFFPRVFLGPLVQAFWSQCARSLNTRVVGLSVYLDLKSGKQRGRLQAANCRVRC